MSEDDKPFTARKHRAEGLLVNLRQINFFRGMLLPITFSADYDTIYSSSPHHLSTLLQEQWPKQQWWMSKSQSQVQREWQLKASGSSHDE